MDTSKIIQVPITPVEERLVTEIIEDSPFPRNQILRLALRIGLETIRKDPTVLMPFLTKNND